MTTLTLDTPLGTLALSSPTASKVLQRHRLDFCCGGKTTLRDACAKRGLDADGLLTELVAETQGAAPLAFDALPLGDLLDHILERYHEPLRTELPRLIAMAEKVERVHATKPDCPLGLTAHLEHIKAEIEAHMFKEEQVLFPAIRAGKTGFVPAPIQVMHEEHEEHGRNLTTTRSLTTDLAPPAHACTTWRTLYLGLEQLERDLMDHIALENNVLFPRALRG